MGITLPKPATGLPWVSDKFSTKQSFQLAFHQVGVNKHNEKK